MLMPETPTLTRDQVNAAEPAPAVEPSTTQPVYARLIKKRDVYLATRQLATLLQAGMPLLTALAAMVEQLQSGKASHQHLARVFQRLHDDVESGAALSQALQAYPKVFSTLFTAVVAAGESSGTLEIALQRLADSLERQLALAGKVKSALAYPTMMTVVAIAVVIFLLAKVVPSITQVFVEMNRALPLPTRCLIAISDFVNHYLVFMALLMTVLGAAAFRFLRTPRGRRRWDEAILRLPVIRDFLLRLEVARLARTLGTLLQAGVPILPAMDITKNVFQNHRLRDIWVDIRTRVQKGQSLAEAIKARAIFPPVVGHLIATGQHAGTVETGLMNIADMYDAELEGSLKTVTSLLEPLILLVMGAVVGFVVMAILLPIFEINQAL